MWDDSQAKLVPGVRQIVVLDDLVAVVGDHMWAALQGLAALVITWNEGPNAGVTTAQVRERLVAASARPGVVAKNIGDVDKALERDAIEVTYDVPFLAHAPMEPMNCTVHVTPTGCEIWTGIQVMSRAQATGAAITGMPLDKGDRPQSYAWWRVRTSARGRSGRDRRAHSAACRCAGEGRLVA